MKKLTTIITVIVIILSACILLAFAGNAEEKAPETYANTARVMAISYGTDTVVVEDYNGNLWAFYGTEDWMEGDCVSLVMSDEGTEEIVDDVILSVRYSGWTLAR